MNPKCPLCNEELKIGRCMYLHSVNKYFYCGAGTPENKDCTFKFDRNGYGFINEEHLVNCFNKEFVPEYSI